MSLFFFSPIKFLISKWDLNEKRRTGNRLCIFFLCWQNGKKIFVFNSTWPTIPILLLHYNCAARWTLWQNIKVRITFQASENSPAQIVTSQIWLRHHILIATNPILFKELCLLKVESVLNSRFGNHLFSSL